MLAVAILSLGLVAPVWAQFVVPAGSAFDVPAGGAFDTACTSVDVAGSLNVHSGTFSTSSNFTIATTGTVDDTAGTLKVGGDFSVNGTFSAGTGTVILTDGCTGNTTTLHGPVVFHNLTLSSSTGRTFVIPAGTQVTVLNTLTLQGQPGQDIQVVSSGGGTAVISLAPGATVQRNHAAVAGNVQVGAAVPAAHGIPTLSGFGLILLSLLLGLVALAYSRRSTPLPAKNKFNVDLPKSQP
ncbi:autotransporter adhesin family protein [Comamonas sp. NLF-1-9]|nr:autotransporter adhesin family protein [Comamonas sp. NLF-1-9]